ncbi:hypothetical protein ColLi_13398 [Colletotrichum liriopes]|uniref:PD-(D/E)XK nuclease-like domain-containing protein n=1 Tax=Colletotrichum liriopes TaxID=708192 RepID=A0AA37H054_9PEZI|nr:hypothetical protein ColLi_13398 [Colletotrichum liriopes]
MDDVVTAWLQDIVELGPTALLSPPPSPPSHKRKAASQRTSDHTKRQAVIEGAMDARQERALRRNNRRVDSGSDGFGGGVSSSASDNDVVDERPGSPTPKSRHGKYSGTIPFRPRTTNTATTTRPGDADPFVTQTAHASAYAAAIDKQSTTSVSNPPSLLTASDTGSKRSRSPVKGMASLQFAEKPVRPVELTRQDQIPGDIVNLVKDIKRIKAGKAIVPKAIRQDVEHAIEAISLLEPELDERNVDTTHPTRPHRELQYELDTLRWVVRDTKHGLSHDMSEAHWNERIHSRILIAAIERDRDPDAPDGCTVSVLNSTQAALAPACIPRRAPHEDMQAKMVDYCVCIFDRDIETAARKAVSTQPRHPASRTSRSTTASSSTSAVSMAKERKLPPLPESINHTEYAPLTLSPITVSIETKKPGGSEDAAKAQLSVWVSGQINRLHQLLGPLPVGITLPLLCVSGSMWQVLFAVEKPDCIVCVSLRISLRRSG